MILENVKQTFLLIFSNPIAIVVFILLVIIATLKDYHDILGIGGGDEDEIDRSNNTNKN